jgi:iron complex outermembrane receptor protein
VAIPRKNLELSLGAEYLNAHYVHYVTTASDYSGNVLPQSPSFSWNGAVGYTVNFTGGSALTTRVNGNYRDKVFFTDDNTSRLSQGSVLLLNAEVDWRSSSGQWEFGAWCRNALDEIWAINMSPLGSFGFDDISMAPPRTFGIAMRYQSH